MSGSRGFFFESCVREGYIFNAPPAAAFFAACNSFS
jgi:hypothetical protein